MRHGNIGPPRRQMCPRETLAGGVDPGGCLHSASLRPGAGGEARRCIRRGSLVVAVHSFCHTRMAASSITVADNTFMQAAATLALRSRKGER
jgi:hypothetical protein